MLPFQWGSWQVDLMCSGTTGVQGLVWGMKDEDKARFLSQR